MILKTATESCFSTTGYFGIGKLFSNCWMVDRQNVQNNDAEFKYGNEIHILVDVHCSSDIIIK
jgi:hypothetical protein